MSSNVNLQSLSAAGAGSASLMYAPPTSTLVASPYTTSLFAPTLTSQSRQLGHTKARGHTPHPRIPHFSHHRSQLPPGVEEQPF